MAGQWGPAGGNEQTETLVRTLVDHFDKLGAVVLAKKALKEKTARTPGPPSDKSSRIWPLIQILASLASLAVKSSFSAPC
jgi:hypothetical protein